MSAAELLQLKDIVLTDYPTIREVIDAKERTFDEFLTLLDKSGKFRRWIHGMSPDANVVAEYVRAVTAEGWASTLPAKAIRYVLGLAVGAVGLLIPGPTGLRPGAGQSFADMFLLEKIANGWRPNYFVEGRLKPFLDVDTDAK